MFRSPHTSNAVGEEKGESHAGFIARSSTDDVDRIGARRSQSTRPATNGRFQFTDLPSGDYFLAALTDLDPNGWQDPSFLEQAMQAAIKLTVVEGQTTVQDVRIK